MICAPFINYLLEDVGAVLKNLSCVRIFLENSALLLQIV